MKKLLLSIGISVFMLLGAYAQTAGDFTFIAFNADGDDDFAIVALSELPDTVFHFSDRNWNGSSFDTGEGTLFWDTDGVIPQGTVVIFSDIDSDGNPGFGSSIGTLTDTGSLNLSVSGDAIWAFVTNSVDDTTFISAIANEDSEFANLNTTGLTLGINAFDLSDGAGTPDGGIYTGSRLNTSFDNFDTEINNFSNWAEDNDNGEVFIPINSTSFALSSSVTISGDAGWRMLSLPITSGTVEELTDDTPIQGITGGADSDSDSNFYVNLASDGSARNGFSEPTNSSTAWGDGLGFILYFFDNSINGSSSLPVTIDADGTEPSSNVSLLLSNTYTLIGNPFSSNIELDMVLGNDSGIGVNDGLISPINIWNDATSSYDTFNFGEGNEISKWQGFFIERNSSSTTSLSIPVLAKTDSTPDAAIFSKQLFPQYRRIDLHLESGDFKDYSTKLYFTNKSTSEKDGFDGSKLSSLNGSPTMAFVQNFGEGEVLLSQDARAFNLETTQSYNLAINDAGVSGVYTLSWDTIKNIPIDWSITFTDLETGEQVNMQSVRSYSFEVDAKQKRPTISALQIPNLKAKASSNNEPRFGITITPNTSVGNEDELTAIGEFKLEQNYPNPFNPSSTIRYSVGKTGPVNISVYNVMGQKVMEIVNETKNAGTYQVIWDASSQASGIYYYRLSAPDLVLTRQMTLIK